MFEMKPEHVDAVRITEFKPYMALGVRWWAYTYRIANFSVGGPNIRTRSGHPE